MVKWVFLSVGHQKHGLHLTLFKNTFFFFFLYNGFIDKALKSRKRKITVPILLHGKSERVLVPVSQSSQVLYCLPASHAVALQVLS